MFVNAEARLLRFDEPLPYADAYELQMELVDKRIADAIPDTFILLQHTPVITLGRRGRQEHLLASRERLANVGVDLVQSTRGGDVTYHGPGQWVVYPILKLRASEAGTHGYLANLEEVAILTACDFGISAFRRDGMAGAWCDQGKFSAIGFKFKKWVSHHGMSLNVRPDLRGFQLIVGCGLTGESVTSFEKVLGTDACPSMEEVGNRIVANVSHVMQRDLVA